MGRGIVNFGFPGGDLVEQDGTASTSFKQWLSVVHRIAVSLQQSGTTANRPTTLLWIGRRYFDTTLGIPVWVQSVGPVVWCNATGAAV